MKKLIILLFTLVLCLTACSTVSTQDVQDRDIPDNGVTVKPKTILPNKKILESLKSDEAKKFVRDGVNADMNSDELYFAVGQKAPDFKVKDINGNEVDFSNMKGEWILEVAATWCAHCQEQSKTYTHEFLSKHPDVKIVHYFDQGTDEEIKEFFETTNADMNEIIIVPYDVNMYGYLGDLWLSQYPTFYVFKDNEIKWVHSGIFKAEHYDEIYDYAFNNKVDLKSLRTSEGYPLRTVIDVQQDLGYEKLLEILNYDTNVKNTLAYTLNNVGKTLDLSNKRKTDVIKDARGSDVDLSKYKGKDVIFYTLILQGEETLNVATNNDIVLLNTFVENTDKDVVLLLLDKDGGKSLDEYDVKPNCDVISFYSNNASEDFIKLEYFEGAQLIYTRNGVVTGVYAGANDLTRMLTGVSMFLGQTPITAPN